MANWQNPKIDYVGGDEVTPDIFNSLGENEKYLKDEQDIIKQTKIVTEQVQEAVVNITQAEERVNLATTEKVKTTFGKIKKWFSDLRALAFKDRVEDNDIIGVSAVKVTGLHSVATSGDYTELNNKPSITKEAVGLANVANERQYSAEYPPTNIDVGLGNVTNEKQYSDQNTPPYPVTSVSGKVGAVELGKADVGLDNLENIRQYSDMNKPPYPVSSVSGKIGDVVITKDDVGLSDVANERQYSVSNPPSYPVTSVNGRTGAVNVNKADVGLSAVANERQYSSVNTPPYPVRSVNGSTGAVSLTKYSIGLGNVANERQYSANNPPPSSPKVKVLYDIGNSSISNYGYPNGFVCGIYKISAIVSQMAGKLVRFVYKLNYNDNGVMYGDYTYIEGYNQVSFGKHEPGVAIESAKGQIFVVCDPYDATWPKLVKIEVVL